MKWVQASGRYRFVWNGDKRPALDESDSALRRLKMLQQTYFPCKDCKAEKVCRVRDTRCEDCLHTKGVKKVENSTVMLKSFKDAVAFGVDEKTGRPLALDTKGRRIDPKDTIYGKTGFDKDPHGWKATGKKVKDKDYGRRSKKD